MRVIQGNKVLIKTWTENVPIEDLAMNQIYRLSEMPFIYKHIAVMPDVHWGKGSTVGSVIPTIGAIIPAAVGVDIGCGMMAVKTPLMASDLPDNLFELRSEIEAAIPHGRTNNGGEGDKGAYIGWGSMSFSARKMVTNLFMGYRKIISRNLSIKPKKLPWLHLGTLGTGNHFIEICVDENKSVWVMLHSGSRGIGNKIGTYFIEKAKEEMRKYYIDKYIPDIDLSYLVENTELFDDYIFAVEWAQKFASANRESMMDTILGILEKKFPEKFSLNFAEEKAINCHHNYVTRENHFGENAFITRKGAVRAREGDLGIIPGSMGAKSFIVRGKGNKDSFCSCSHGAGRIMGRNEAKKKFTLEDHIKATEGVECRKDDGVIDETPGAYKDIDTVMAAQSYLVDIVYTLKQVICIKG